MVATRSDDAISEVIGFVLILALIAIVASLYLTYVVPSQGRDLEIAHMDVIQNQFLDYKTTVDSLWLNNQYNTQISSPFTLGTNPGSSQGSFINLPLFQPVTSGGTMVVTTEDTITVTTDSRYADNTPGDNLPVTEVVSAPDHLYVSVRTTNTSKPGLVKILPYPATNGNWEVQLSTSPGNQLTMTVLKNNNPTVSNIIIQNSMVSGQYYPIDLADTIYGLKDSFKYPFTLNISPDVDPVNSLPTGYHVRTDPIIFNHNMGSLEYHSSNNYWITQDYIYQYGGVFLQQDTGAVVKLLPSITISRDKANTSLARVSINDITIPGTIPSKVGGSSLVEVLTTLQKPTSGPIVNPPATGVSNTRFVTVTINARDAQTAQMWKDTFTKIKQQSNVPDNWIDIQSSGTTAIMTIHGNSGTSDGTMYDVIFESQSSIAKIYLSPTSY
jgi:hypothetical protein